MSTWPAHQLAGVFVLIVIVTAVRHLPRLNLGCPPHLLSTRMVRCVTMETLTRLPLFPLHVCETRDWPLTSQRNQRFELPPWCTCYFTNRRIFFRQPTFFSLTSPSVCLSSPHLHVCARCGILPPSGRCCLSILSSLPSSESILVLICDSSFLIVSSWSVFTGSIH